MPVPGLKNRPCSIAQAYAATRFSTLFTSIVNDYDVLSGRCLPGNVCEMIVITLSGGSLGSCVDEERSQLRELM